MASGNMFRDPFPEDCDVHLFPMCFMIGRARGCGPLKRSHAVMPRGGLLVIHDAFINSENRPLAVAEYSALLMHSTQGKCYSIGEYSELLSGAGFVVGAYSATTANRGFL